MPVPTPADLLIVVPQPLFRIWVAATRPNCWVAVLERGQAHPG